MEIQFTPWRMAYIKGDTAPGDDGCVLCNLHHAAPAHDRENLVVYRGASCYVVLNRYPYNTAHLMVVPYTHTADLPGMDAATAAELFELTRRCAAVLADEYQPHGMNMGMNIGQTAGAGIAAHLHMHLVPRWNGDTNFMPLIGGTKLVPEDLDRTYSRLQPYFEA
jgi:ATP adenylyltransferase